MTRKNDPIEISTEEARGAVKTGHVSTILFVSMALAVAAMILLGLLYI